jgi:hypothetical protein
MMAITAISARPEIESAGTIAASLARKSFSAAARSADGGAASRSGASSS